MLKPQNHVEKQILKNIFKVSIFDMKNSKHVRFSDFDKKNIQSARLGEKFSFKKSFFQSICKSDIFCFFLFFFK